MTLTTGLLIVWMTASGADMATTIIATNAGARQQNKLYRLQGRQ